MHPTWIRGVIEGMAGGDEVDDMPQEAEGWLVLTGGVPKRWRERAVPLYLVPLLPQETERIVAGGTALPGVTIEDEPLLRVVANGQKTSAMARELGIPQRTVERKLERLRRLFDVPSTADLTILLARLGFGHPRGGAASGDHRDGPPAERQPPRGGGSRARGQEVSGR
jgi:DNA-binding CsgD family transcriptional regulator